jgi:hypothetical protein
MIMSRILADIEFDLGSDSVEKEKKCHCKFDLQAFVSYSTLEEASGEWDQRSEES